MNKHIKRKYYLYYIYIHANVSNLHAAKYVSANNYTNLSFFSAQVELAKRYVKVENTIVKINNLILVTQTLNL